MSSTPAEIPPRAALPDPVSRATVAARRAFRASIPTYGAMFTRFCAVLLTLFAIAIGSIVGLARGGKWAGPTSVTFQNGGLLVAAITIALVQTILNPIFPVLWVLLGAVLLIVFAARNRHLAGMTVVLIGAAVNLLPLLANWAVPISELALISAGSVDEFGNPEIGGAFESTATATRLSFLGHGIPVPVFGTVVSIGDLITLVGIGDVVTNLFLSARTRELTLAEAGVSFANASATTDVATPGAAHAAGTTSDGLVSILSPLQTGIRRSTDSERRRVGRNKAAPPSHVPAHAADPVEPVDPVDTPPPPTEPAHALSDSIFGVPEAANEPHWQEPEWNESPEASDETAAEPAIIDLVGAEHEMAALTPVVAEMDEPVAAEPVAAELEIIEPVAAEPAPVQQVASAQPAPPIVISLDEDGQIAPVESGGLFDQDIHIAAGAPVAKPAPAVIPEGTDAITAAGIQAVPVLPTTARTPQPEPVPEVIDLTDPDDSRPIIDLTKSPTDEQMAEFLRRRKAADRNLERVPIRPPGQRRGRAPVRISLNREDGVAKGQR